MADNLIDLKDRLKNISPISFKEICFHGFRKDIPTLNTENADAQKVLKKETDRYNYKQVHSTTGEVPYYLLKRKIANGELLFREFLVPKPYLSTKDIFALRDQRTVNPYRRISFNSLVINITGVPIRDRVSLRIVPDLRSGMAEIRFWYKGKLVGTYQVRNEDLNLPNF